MKNKLIDSVIAKMGETLSPQELFALRKALEFELEFYEIFPTPDMKTRPRKANDDLAAQFISAKRIEGCSEKTLNYYENTIRAFLDETSKELHDVTTNEIRKYLSDFQAREIPVGPPWIMFDAYCLVSSHGLKMRTISLRAQ